ADPEDVVTWQYCQRYLDQVQACNALIEHYMLQFTEAADLLNRTGLYSHEHALYAIAEPLYQRALSICEQQLGASHPDVAHILSNLGGLYRAQGKYAEAESLLQRALSIREQQLGASHLDVARSLNSLAQIYHAQGKYAEAES